jgi:hypothetical protein
MTRARLTARNREVTCGAGGLVPPGVRIPPPVHCPDRPTVRNTGERSNREKPNAWEEIWGARDMIALAELSSVFASGTPPPIA